MCGRFGLSDVEQMEARFGVELTERLPFEPTYNAAPGQTLPVIVPEATGITAYLENGGTIENAQAIAAHESPRTTKLYDRTSDEITLDEVERIAI